MKKSLRITLSRFLASVMLISSAFGTTYVSAEDSKTLAAYEDVSTSGAADDVTSGSSVEAGKTYTFDLTDTETADLSSYTSADGVFTYKNLGGGKFHSTGYGLAVKPGDTIEFEVAGNADISLLLSSYAPADGVFTITDEAGNEVGSIAAKVETDKTENSFSYTGAAAKLKLTYNGGGQGYLAKVTVANAALPVGEAENFELWLDDIATDVESTAEDGTVTVTKTIKQQTINYKDSALTLVGNKDGDTLKDFTPEWGNGQNVTRAGKTVNGYKAGSRNATANDIATVPQFGDGTAIVFTPAATGTFNTYIASTSFLRVWDFDAATGERYGYVDSDVAVESFAFKAQAGHTYVLSTTGKTNNMVYCGFEYIIDEATTVAVSRNNINANEASLPTLEISLTDAALGTVETVVKADTTEVKLAKGHTYKLSTNDGGVKASVAGSDSFKATGDAIVIDLEDIPDQTLTGEITGTPEGTVSELTFTNQLNGAKYTATITGTTYSCVLKPGEYNTAVVTNNGGVTYDHVSVAQGADNTNEVWVELPSETVTTYDLPTEVGNADSAIKFVSANEASPIRVNNSTSIRATAGDKIVVPVNGVQKVTVSGWYAGTWDINGQNSVTTSSSASASSPTTNSYTTDGTETEVTINITAEGANYLYWVKVEDCVTFKSEINVPGDYATLNEADDAINAMVGRPAGEEGRVTINLTADTQEQVTFDAPYVTLKGNGHEVSWYYGVGTFYYSIDGSTGLYSERLFRDKYASNEGNGSLWGGVAIIRGDNFIAEDTTFKNTYNYEVVDKEVEDVAYTVGGIPARTKDTDVTKYVSKERCNAFYIEAKNIEAYRCNILGSQDTLGRNGSANNGYSAYFKDCTIGGNTDYICGEFTAIFDNCNLQWKTFANDASNNGKVGFITAPKTSPYIFRNCQITSDGAGNDEDVKGLYGRTWGKDSNAVFINTETNGFIKADGWGQMSSGEGSSAKFKEYGNTNKGEAFATVPDAALGIADTTLDEATATAMMSDDVVNTYLSGWTPKHYSYEPPYTGVWGDADKSGILSANDASAVLAYVLDNSLAANDAFDFAGCDVDDSGEITAQDASMILQKVLDAEFTFPAEPTTEAVTEETTLPIDEAANYAPADKAEVAFAKTVVYNGVNASVKTMQEMNYVVNADGSMTAFEGGIEYPGYAASTSVSIPMTVDGVSAPAWRVAYAVTAKNDCKVLVDAKVNNGKAIVLTKEEPVENAVISSVVNFANTEKDMFTTVSADVKAGETLYIIGKSTNLPIYGIRFLTGSEEDTTEGTTEDTPENPAKIFVVGDSTACHYAENADASDYYKRVGYGDRLADYMDAEVVNLALSGRSSKSFMLDPEYTTLLTDMKQGDYLIIAFGHNDEKNEADRYTAPGGTKDTEGTFKNSLYANYIAKANAVGATPILVTPIVRRVEGNWTDNSLHKANGGDYAQDVRDLGAELGLTVVDATTLTKNLYDTMTKEQTANLHRQYSSKSVDNTHLNNYGAKYVAYMVAEDIKASTSTLAPYVKANNVAPTEADLIVNPDWVEPDKGDVIGDALNSILWTTTSPWHGSVMGDFGGASKLLAVDAAGVPVEPITLTKTGDNTNFNISENADGSVNVRCGLAKNDVALASKPASDAAFGKIAGSSDGLAMYYQAIDASVDFSLSGTITLNGYQEKNNQVAFGAIVADKIWVDTYDAAAIPNYVAASPLRFADIGKTDAVTGEILNAKATYARINGALTYGTNAGIATAPVAGDTVKVSIVKKGDVYTVTYGDFTETYTVPMTDTIYAGFYAARCANITVTDINFNNEIVE